MKRRSDICKPKVKLRERQLFGKKSEQGTNNSGSLNKGKPNRNRGQQREQKSPLKRDYSHLPVIPEIQEIPENDRICPCCNALYADMGATEDSDVIEVEVQAHIRRLKRKKYRRTCSCQSQPVILTAPQAPKIFPKSHLRDVRISQKEIKFKGGFKSSSKHQ